MINLTQQTPNQLHGDRERDGLAPVVECCELK